MLSKVRSLGVLGIGGYEVSVECFLSGGLPGFDLVGLPDAAVRESKERVRAAIKSCGLSFPVSRLTINLAPADVKKVGTVYDLPVLLGILSASGEIDALPQNAAFFGELGLDGEIRPVCGALSMALCAKERGIEALFVPAANAEEAAFAEGLRIFPAENLEQLLAHLSGRELISATKAPKLPKTGVGVPDFADVKGQENVKRALEIAAAGGHNILLVGPPGAGKSMLAKRLPGILPDMSREEALETTAVWSAMGLTDRERPIIVERPFRSPHHSVSGAAMAGGGAVLRPGEISLAHNGVLFLDELPEFRRDALEVLRQPLEDGEITISRIAGSIRYPSRFMLVCAMNPCVCGWFGHENGRCRCSEKSVKNYHSKISGPLLDRIDMIVEAPALEYEELRRKGRAESSAMIKERVNKARQIQRERNASASDEPNARMNAENLAKFCALDEDCEKLMKRAFSSLSLTARSYDRILRVARTIADLGGCETIGTAHLAEAVQYRTYDFREGAT